MKKKYQNEQQSLYLREKELNSAMSKQKALLKELTENQIQLEKYSKRFNQEKEYKKELEDQIMNQNAQIKQLEMEKKMLNDTIEMNKNMQENYDN